MGQGIADCELDIMEILWDFGDGAMEQTRIKEELERRKQRQYSRPTVSTWLLRLKKRGLVSGYVKKGVSFYLPLITREDYQRMEIRMLEERLFQSSHASLVAAFAGYEKMTEEESRKIEEILDTWDNPANH